MSIGYSSPDWGIAGEDAAYTRAQAIGEAKQEAFSALEDEIEYLVMKTAFEYREALKQCQDETPRPVGIQNEPARWSSVD